MQLLLPAASSAPSAEAANSKQSLTTPWSRSTSAACSPVSPNRCTFSGDDAMRDRTCDRTCVVVVGACGLPGSLEHSNEAEV